MDITRRIRVSVHISLFISNATCARTWPSCGLRASDRDSLDAEINFNNHVGTKTVCGAERRCEMGTCVFVSNLLTLHFVSDLMDSMHIYYEEIAVQKEVITPEPRIEIAFKIQIVN